MAHLNTTDGGTLYYEHHRLPANTAAGGAARPTLILSHGWGMASPVWVNTLARMQDAGYDVVVYDHRCCGRSDKDFGDVSIDAQGSDLVTLVDHLELSKVVLNGWSLGGAIVTDAAAKLGGRLAGLVHTGGASPRYTQAPDFPYGGQVADVAATIEAARADRVNFLKALYCNSVFAADVGDDVKHWCWQLAMQASPAGDAALLSLAEVDQRDTLRNLAVPLLVFTGDQDLFVPAVIGQAAADMAPQSTLVALTDCGHAPFLEWPDAYHGALIEFMGGLA